MQASRDRQFRWLRSSEVCRQCERCKEMLQLLGPCSRFESLPTLPTCSPAACVGRGGRVLAAACVALSFFFGNSALPVGVQSESWGAIWNPPSLGSPGRLELAPTPFRSLTNLAACVLLPTILCLPTQSRPLGPPQCQWHKLVPIPCKKTQGHFICVACPTL